MHSCVEFEKIVAVVCEDEQQEFHIFKIECEPADVKSTDCALYIDNVFFPYNLFQSITICDEESFKEIMQYVKNP